MGNYISGWAESLFGSRKANIVMIGLDAAGKTTILDKLKLNVLRETVPTIGFNVETVQYRNVLFHLWDVGGQMRLRSLWKAYYEGANAVIFVIDSNDRARIPEVIAELSQVVRDPMLVDAVLLVLGNKQDLPHHLTPAELVDRLGFRDQSPEGLGRLLRNRKWFLQGCCAQSGEGVFEGLDWLCNNLPAED